MMRTLACPHCSFSKEVPTDRIPPQMKAVICPRCKQRFPLEPALSASQCEADADTAGVAIAATKLDQRTGKVAITCPKCGERKVMPGDRLPMRKVTLRCQACAHVFDFEGRRRTNGIITRKPSSPPAPLKTADHPILAGRPAPAPQVPVQRRLQLSGTGRLLGKAWRDCRQRLPTLFGLNLLAVPGAAVAYLILTSGTDLVPDLLGDGQVAAWLVGSLHLLFAIVLASWVGAANTLAVSDDELGALAALLLGVQRCKGFFLVYGLTAVMIAGGLVFLILPGLRLAAGFGLAPLVHLREERPAMEALLKSRAYARKRPAVYRRLFLPGLTAALTLFLLFPLPLIGLLLLVPLTPLGFAYLHALYNELEECGDPLAFSCSFGEKARWFAVGLGGCLLALLLATGVFGPAPPQALAKMHQWLSFEDESESRLRLKQDRYSPGELLTAHFSVPAHFPRDAWVGIVPSRVPHGEEAVNQKHTLSYQHLEGRTQGVLHFRVPNQPGGYDLRLHDQDLNGRETASVSFEVTAAK